MKNAFNNNLAKQITKKNVCKSEEKQTQPLPPLGDSVLHSSGLIHSGEVTQNTSDSKVTLKDSAHCMWGFQGLHGVLFLNISSPIKKK